MRIRQGPACGEAQPSAIRRIATTAPTAIHADQRLSPRKASLADLPKLPESPDCLSGPNATSARETTWAAKKECPLRLPLWLSPLHMRPAATDFPRGNRSRSIAFSRRQQSHWTPSDELLHEEEHLLTALFDGSHDFLPIRIAVELLVHHQQDIVDPHRGGCAYCHACRSAHRATN